MKKLFSLWMLVVICTFTTAQEKQFVEVTYQMTMDMDADEVIKNIPSQYRAMVEDQIRQELADGIFIDYTLQTNGEESTYVQVEQISNAQTQGGMIAQQMRTFDKGVMYKSIPENYYMKPVDMMGTQFMIKDSLQNLTWEIMRDKEEIAGFETRMANGTFKYNDSIINTKAWYTPKIAIKDGPGNVWGLPGLILKTEFTMNGADITLTATKVVVKEEEINIEKPKGGKEVTQSEFEAELKAIQEKYKEMMGEGVDTE